MLITPLVILISGLWAIHKCFKKWNVVFWIIVAYIITFTLEALGVAFSLFFGPYYYGEVLGPKILNVPVVIGLNWVIIILSLVLFSEWAFDRLIKPSFNNKMRIFFISLFTAILATLFDYIMEPAAIGLNYWTWTLTNNPMIVPIQNYIAWFLISFLFAISYLIIPKIKRCSLRESPQSPWFVLIQTVFFIATRIFVVLK